MIIFGLSGGTASGKTQVARLFSQFGEARVFNADREVHKMYEHDASIIGLVREYFPDSIHDGCVSRKELLKHFVEYGSKWQMFQEALYSELLIRQNRFITESRIRKARYVILDIPMILEAGYWRSCDFIVWVRASRAIQVRRLRERGISQEGIKCLLSRQVQAEKRRNFADFSINTCGNIRDTALGVLAILNNSRVNAQRDIHFHSQRLCILPRRNGLGRLPSVL
ncbi:dephospho-CoA kinase [Anaplasma phagocytophilum]|uniref:dephospho-CoA kinase n=1 Tax=Anaplasma phagocytophilum TaxID=948 RepID=UPI0005337DB9|nr:dephospho-CoA kinase [Anaplasma phagocytophilum]KDB57126.1 dephospho-CoA kinase [Anaplasma phagocytophilum str. CRT35]